MESGHMDEDRDGRLTRKDRDYLEGLRQVARFSWLIYLFVAVLLFNLGAAAYFAKAIYYQRDIIIWQSVSQCITLLFFIIIFREKLIAHRVISRLMNNKDEYDEDGED
jgi:hypothetical protein